MRESREKWQQNPMACWLQASSPSSPAAQAFAARGDRRRRQSVGAKVGQALVLAMPHETFVQARPAAHPACCIVASAKHPAWRC